MMPIFSNHYHYYISHLFFTIINFTGALTNANLLTIETDTRAEP